MDDNTPNNDDNLKCPNCQSTDIKEISEDERMMALGVYDIYNFIGNINKLTVLFQCNQCYFEF